MHGWAWKRIRIRQFASSKGVVQLNAQQQMDMFRDSPRQLASSKGSAIQLSQQPLMDIVGDSHSQAYNDSREQILRKCQEESKVGENISGYAFVAPLKACASSSDLREGRLLHVQIIESGLQNDAYLGNLLIDMYVKCRRIDEAKQMFDTFQNRSVVTWNIIISGFAFNGYGEKSLLCFYQMICIGVLPNCITLLCILKACSIIRDIDDMELIFTYIVERDLESEAEVCNTLVDAYGKCGRFLDAQKIFDRVSSRDVLTWSAMMTALCRYGHDEEALQLFEKMQLDGLAPNKPTYILALKSCVSTELLGLGMLLHADIIESTLEADLAIQNTLIDMYAKFGALRNACKVFKKSSTQDVVTWTILIECLASNGLGENALSTFRQMQIEGVEANDVTYLSVLKACSSVQALYEGKRIHCCVIQNGLMSDSVIGNTLIDLYCKCRSLNNARRLFDDLKVRDVVTWSTMIGSYAEYQYTQEAFELLHQMYESGFRPNELVYASILKVCPSADSQFSGNLIHADIIKHGFESDFHVQNSLISMYVRCGELKYARGEFSKLTRRDVVTWTAMIAGLAQAKHGEDAFQLFQQMQNEGIEPNQVTLVSLLKASSDVNAVTVGMVIHSHAVELGLVLELIVCNALISLYLKCGELSDAQTIFNKSPDRDVVTWSVIIAGYAKHGCYEEALDFFYQMQKDGIKPNSATYISVFKSCAVPAALDLCHIIYVYIVKVGIETFTSIANNLINMYGRCSSLLDASAVFELLPNRDVITWTVMIGMLTDIGLCEEALWAFHEMLLQEFEPNRVTFLVILKACSNLCALEIGEVIHAQIYERGIDISLSILNTLVDMYAKCTTLVNAQCIFDKLPRWDVVTWTALIEGYVEDERGEEALELFKKMLQNLVEPNKVTLMSVVKACVNIVAIDQGKIIHAYAIERSDCLDVNISSVLMDMYMKCGSFEDAYRMFTDLPRRNNVAWSSILTGFAQGNDYANALECFESMQNQGVKPDGVAFLSLLSACNHAGLFDKGLCHFKSMAEQSIKPSYEHYNCIIDLLGRTGHLNEAKLLLETMPFQTDGVGLTSLIWNCEIHGDFQLGNQCFLSLVEADRRIGTGYTLMSSAFAHADMQNVAGRLEGMRKTAHAWKIPAKASIEINTMLQNFTVRDTSHPRHNELQIIFERLSLQLRNKGYLPQLDLTLDFIGENAYGFTFAKFRGSEDDLWG